MIRTIFDALVGTTASPILLVLRLVLAFVIWPHGAQKVLGWFGGYGLKGTMGFFTQTMKIPSVFAAAAIAAEFLGPIALALGLFGRVAALAIAVVMLVAVLTTHVQNGFFMNWIGTGKGEGFEYHLLAMAIALAIAIGGSGALSLDYHLLHRV